MTTAHRPTFDPARGGTGRNEGDLSKLSRRHLKLKLNISSFYGIISIMNPI